jgi:hypothetical protein
VALPNARDARPMTDAEAIRERIIRWAFAVHTGDLETVLAGHDPDIMMSTCRRRSSSGSDRAPQFAETAGRSQFSPLLRSVRSFGAKLVPALGQRPQEERQVRRTLG